MPETPRKILLVGWDSADWRLLTPLMERGLMPVLSTLVKRGAWGNLASIEPLLSPVVWTSIATGKLPHRHGVLGFIEPIPIAEDGLAQGVRPVGSTTRQTAALWNMLTAAGLTAHVIGWFASHPAESISGVCVSERFPLPASHDLHRWPLPENCVTPVEAAMWLKDLRLHPTEIDGDALLPFIPRAAELDQSDPRTGRLLTELARILARASSIQAAATAILEKSEPWHFLGVYFQALDELGHHFMPYHPPVLAGIDAREAAIHGQVMEMGCRFHDRMLGHLIELAGPDTTVIVVSDHGFESGPQRPGTVANDHTTMAGWHRRYGVVAMAGPGIVAGERLYGSSVLDIAPTVLHLLGLPVGADMDGKVLLSAMEQPGTVERRDSWDEVWSPTVPRGGRSGAEEQAAMEQLAALGYLEAPAPDVGAARDLARREIAYNRISSLVDAGKAAEAVPLARELAAECPSERRHQLKSIQTLLAARQPAEAQLALADLEARLGPCSATQRMTAHCLVALRRPVEAMAHFREAEALGGPNPLLHEHIGSILLQQRQWKDAENRFRAALALEADRPHSFVGLARALVRQDRDAEALDAALDAVGLLHFLPIGHFQLGAILAKMGDYDRAAQSFETGLSMQPGNAHALRYLALLRLRKNRPQRVEASWTPRT